MGAHLPGLQYDGAVRESKLLWVLGNYSLFVKPGMVRIHCELSTEQSPVDGLLVSAYQDLENGSKDGDDDSKEKEDGSLVYVLTNLSENTFTVSVGGSDKVRCYTTDRNSNLEYSLQRARHIVVPGRSVITLLK